jgi:hypothetical protein
MRLEFLAPKLIALLGHSYKKKEPTQTEVNDLIDGVEKISKILF